MDTLSRMFGTGVEAQHLQISQIVLRALLVFFVSLAIVRLADKRFFARKSAFDVLLGFILGSMLARAINGSETLSGTIVAGFVLALLHRFMGWLACRWPKFGSAVKGHSETIVRNGVIDGATLARHHIAMEDLTEGLRLNGILDVEDVRLAQLERSGEISAIRKQ